MNLSFLCIFFLFATTIGQSVRCCVFLKTDFISANETIHNGCASDFSHCVCPNVCVVSMTYRTQHSHMHFDCGVCSVRTRWRMWRSPSAIMWMWRKARRRRRELRTVSVCRWLDDSASCYGWQRECQVSNARFRSLQSFLTTDGVATTSSRCFAEHERR